jgi:Tol biopolymer transport system component
MGRMRLAVALVLGSALVAGLAWSLSANGSERPSSAKPAWLVLSSTRDGLSGKFDLKGGLRAYSMRPDGTRLTRLLEQRRELDPVAVSADGTTIAYGEGEYAQQTVYASRADGTGLSRVAHFPPDDRFIQSTALSPDGQELALTTRDGDGNPRLFVIGTDGRHRRDLGRAADPDWSPDGKKLILATGHGCVVATEPFENTRGARIRGKCRVPKWSPDGSKLVFETSGGCAVVTVPPPGWTGRLQQAVQGGGGRVLLGPRCASPGWSPDARWIAFETGRGLWVSRPNGRDSRRLGPAHDVTDLPYAWSPDSTRIAAGNLVLTLTGETTRLRFGSEESAPVWLAGGKRLAIVGRAREDPAQLWSVRADGSGLRRLTSAGVNEPVGLARPAPARPPVGPPPWSERVLGPTTVETRTPIGLLSADGARVAYIPASTGADCQHVSIWTPADGSIERVWQRLPAPCQDDVLGEGDSLFELALARSFIGWSEVYLCGNSGCGSELKLAALPERDPEAVADDDGTDYGNESHAAFGPVGHGSIFASSWVGIRVALPDGKIRRCKPGNDDYLSVDGRWIAAYRGQNIVVLDDTCAVVRAFHLGKVQRVLLDGDRLVVAHSGQLEAYDVDSGALELQRPLPPGYSLADVSRGIALLRHKGTILLLRLEDGRTYTLRPGRGHVSAELEAPGLYYSYAIPERGGRLVFVPRSELERRLA